MPTSVAESDSKPTVLRETDALVALVRLLARQAAAETLAEKQAEVAQLPRAHAE